MSLVVAAAVTIGLIAGWLTSGHIHFPGYIESIAFAVMLFGVGLELGQDGDLWRKIRRAGWKMVLFPLNIIVGTTIGAVVSGLLLGMSVTKTCAVASGFGWYSLAAVLLNELDGPRLAAVAFISNVLRELLTFVFLPFIARYGGGLTAVALGGATSMDTTLPFIARYTNPHVALYGFASGVLLSTLVPLLVPLWMQL